MSKLHHKSARYEVQIFKEHTLSWRPIAHTKTAEEAIGILTKAIKEGAKKQDYRILDRKNGANKPTVLAGNNSLKVTLK